MPLPVVYHPDYVIPLAGRSRFPMEKFGLVYSLLRRNGYSHRLRFFRPHIVSDEHVLTVHSQEYYTNLVSGTLNPSDLRRIALPWSPELIRRTRTGVGGSIHTAELALRYGLACNTAGGTHHAYPEFGAGYCLLNDLAITARVVQKEHGVARILITDLDVHQGDGTAVIFQNDPSVFTLSMHCETNYPLRKQRSDLDIALPAGIQDQEYLELLYKQYPRVLDSFRPDLVLYDAGVDPHVADDLGTMELTDEGLQERDCFVLHECLSRNIPVACFIGGGYGELRGLSRRHTIIHKVASELYEKINHTGQFAMKYFSLTQQPE